MEKATATDRPASAKPRGAIESLGDVLAFLIYGAALFGLLALGILIGLMPIIWVVDVLEGHPTRLMLSARGAPSLIRQLSSASLTIGDYLLIALICWGIIRLPQTAYRYFPKSFFGEPQ